MASAVGELIRALDRAGLGAGVQTEQGYQREVGSDAATKGQRVPDEVRLA